MVAMAERMDGMSMGLEPDFLSNFRRAVTEALALSGSVAFAAALLLRVYVSRRVVPPVQEM